MDTDGALGQLRYGDKTRPNLNRPRGAGVRVALYSVLARLFETEVTGEAAAELQEAGFLEILGALEPAFTVPEGTQL
jgi:hypothetical protein